MTPLLLVPDYFMIDLRVDRAKDKKRTLSSANLFYHDILIYILIYI